MVDNRGTLPGVGLPPFLFLPRERNREFRDSMPSSKRPPA
jgi:hypothetical protein